MQVNSIQDYTDSLQGVYVVVRLSLNVPLHEGVPTDIFRIKRSLPTLEFLQQRGARIIVLAHLGRDVEDTLLPVCTELQKHIPNVSWGDDVLSEEFATARAAMADGDILVAENLRQHPEEKANDPGFAAHLATLGSVYVNDAFGNVHREHASMVGLAERLPAYAGINVAAEVVELTKVMDPQHPSLFMLGGAKFETKMPLIEKYLDVYDHIFIGGALANDLFKARGCEVGQSLVSGVEIDPALVTNDKIVLPIDVEVEGANGRRFCGIDEVAPHESILDAGPETVRRLEAFIKNSKTILWNGPFGNFEAGFATATEMTAKLVAESKAYSVIGGGDTIAAIEKLGINDSFGFLSTGGGSTLTFLEEGTTPALELLKK